MSRELNPIMRAAIAAPDAETSLKIHGAAYRAANPELGDVFPPIVPSCGDYDLDSEARKEVERIFKRSRGF